MELLAPGARTAASGVGAAVDLGLVARLLRVTLDVTAHVGTLSIVVESAPSSTGPWRACGEPTSEARSTTIAFDQWVRLRWIGEEQDGEPPTPFSATFGVTATAERCYANLDDLYTYGRPASALSGVSTTVIANALGSASTKADGKLGLRFDLPLATWGTDISEAVAKIAAYDLLSFVGFNPDGIDANIRTRHDDAWKWFAQVGSGQVNPVGLGDATADVVDDGIVFVTNPRRGW